MTLLDQMAGRTYPDTIVHAMSNYDTHGYTVAPYSELKHPLRTPFWTYLPYRCLLPRELEGILVSGIGISAQRDAQPLVRMQPELLPITLDIVHLPYDHSPVCLVLRPCTSRHPHSYFMRRCLKSNTIPVRRP